MTTGGQSGWWGLIACLFFAAAAGAAVQGPTPNENRAVQDAKQLFQDGFYQAAEAKFAAFARNFPESEQLADVVLWQAQARFQLQQYAGAMELLEPRLKTVPPPLAEQYRYWMAESFLAKGEPRRAAEEYSRWLQDFPSSGRQLEVSFKEAFAEFASRDWKRVIELLSSPESRFVKLAQPKPTDRWAVQGRLLLAEAQAESQEFAAAEASLAAINPAVLPAEQKWQHQILLTRLPLLKGELPEARRQSSNLWALAIAGGQPSLRARAGALQAEIMERANEPEGALQLYAANLTTNAPSEFRRQALLKSVELRQRQNQADLAIKLLQGYLQEHPQDPLTDLAHLSLGELWLKQYYQGLGTNATGVVAAGATNLLALAAGEFDQVLTNAPPSPWRGRAYLNRGWCFWEEGRLADSVRAFADASAALPESLDHAIARFKLADAHMRQTNYAAALTNYQAVVEQYEKNPEVRAVLLDQALYQMIAASAAVGDMEAAERSLQKILEWYPDSFFADQSMLVVGYGFKRLGRPDQARQHFEAFARKFPGSALLPQAELAIARTFVQEQNWPAAAEAYERWVTQFTNQVALPQALFDQAWVNYQANRDTNAFQLFATFLGRFPQDAQAPRALKWIGDYFMRHGDFTNAEANYQKLFQNTNWPPSELTYQAYLAAGLAAIKRQGWGEARDYYLRLIRNGPPTVPDSRIPSNIVAEAYFALADSYRSGSDPPGSTNRLDKFITAIQYFSVIPQSFPSNRLVPLALGSIAHCHLQLAGQYPASYDEALNKYREVMASPLADIDTRSEAAVGQGNVLEILAKDQQGASRTALLDRALKLYLDVANGTDRRSQESLSLYWSSVATLKAARLAETLEMWEPAKNLYLRVMNAQPALRGQMEPKIETLTRKINTQKN